MTPSMSGGCAAVAATPTPLISPIWRCCSGYGTRAAATTASPRTPRTPLGHTVARSAGRAQRAPSACSRRWPQIIRRRFLDIGCGLGETVRIFADNGWDAEGVDADPSTAPFPPRARHPRPHRAVRADRDDKRVRCHSYRARNLLHHRSDELYPRRARAARGRVACSASCLRTSWRTPTLPYRHMFTLFFRPRHQCVMRFRSPDSKRYSVGVYREAYSWLPAPCRPRPGRSLAQ